jgi:hypothetical protein
MSLAAIVLASSSAVNVVVLASAIVPVVIAVLVIRVAWIWARSHDEGWRLTFSELLRKAFWLDRRHSGTSG